MNKGQNKHIAVRDLGFSLLAEGKILKIKADGYSMYPTVKPGSVIYIEPLTEKMSPAPGEIIAWKRESGFVVHRLVRIIRNGDKTIYFTRGDSCSYEDQPVTKEIIAGRVVRVENLNKEIISAAGLARRHCCFINRLRVWFILKTKRIFNLLANPPAPLKGG
jgi:signal peptidase I